MKKLFVSAAALAVMTTGAFAQTATQTITLNATVPGFCQIDTSATGAARSGTITPSAVGTVAAAAVNIGTDSPAVCNVKSKVTLTSANGGVKNATSATAPFTNLIGYTATATFDGATATLTTTGTAGENISATNAAGGAQSGPLAVTVTTAATAGGTYLVAGAYTDTLTVKLEPNP